MENVFLKMLDSPKRHFCEICNKEADLYVLTYTKLPDESTMPVVVNCCLNHTEEARYILTGKVTNLKISMVVAYELGMGIITTAQSG